MAFGYETGQGAILADLRCGSSLPQTLITASSLLTTNTSTSPSACCRAAPARHATHH